MNVYMDDQRSCPYGYLLATTVESAMQIVRNHDVNILSLDFNMGWRQSNGLDFVETFVKKDYMFMKFTSIQMMSSVCIR